MALIALYRPGPMEQIPTYIERKNDPSKIAYLHPALEDITKETYGVLVYQEQIVLLLQKLAGYTPGEADMVRKAIGKKKRDIMAAEEPRFIEGCKKSGHRRSTARRSCGRSSSRSPTTRSTGRTPRRTPTSRTRPRG